MIHGTDDRVFPLDFGRHLAGLIAGADFVVVDGVGHAPSMEQPAQVAEAIRGLVEKVMTKENADAR